MTGGRQITLTPHRPRLNEPDEKAFSAVAFLKVAVAYSESVDVSRVITDNCPSYAAFDFRDACREPGLRHDRT
jgi:hypothetical protein